MRLMLCPLCCAEQGQDGLSQVRGVNQELQDTEWRGSEAALQHSQPGASRVPAFGNTFLLKLAAA